MVRKEANYTKRRKIIQFFKWNQIRLIKIKTNTAYERHILSTREIYFHANIKVYFNTENISRDEKEYFITIKTPIHQEVIQSKINTLPIT